MNTFVKYRKKYGSDIASWLSGVTTYSKSTYDCWTYDFKTRTTREKWFKKQFCGPETNYQPEKICLN